MKKIGLALLAIALLLGAYWSYEEFWGRGPVHTEESLRAYGHFNKFVLGEAESYFDLFPVSQEDPVSASMLPIEISLALDPLSASPTSATSVSYSDGTKGYHAEYSSSNSMEAEHERVLQALLGPEGPTAQSFVGEERAYISQETPLSFFFIEFKKTTEGVKVGIFTRGK